MSDQQEFSPRRILDALHEVRTRAPMRECDRCAVELAELTGLDVNAVFVAPFTRGSELERVLAARPEVTGHALGVVLNYLGGVGDPPAV